MRLYLSRRRARRLNFFEDKIDRVRQGVAHLPVSDPPHQIFAATTILALVRRRMFRGLHQM